MAVAADTSGGATGGSGPRDVVPTRTVGWWAVGLAALGAVAWTVLPIVAGVVGDANAALSSGVMVAGMLLLVVAAVFNLLAVTLWKQRSVLNIVAAVIVLPAVILVLMLALGGFFNGVV